MHRVVLCLCFTCSSGVPAHLLLPGFGRVMQACTEKLLLFQVSEFASCPASPGLLFHFDTPCGLNGFPRLQLQPSHHSVLAAGAGNPPLPSSSLQYRYHIFLMHLSPILSRHLLQKKQGQQMFVGWQAAPLNPL